MSAPVPPVAIGIFMTFGGRRRHVAGLTPREIAETMVGRKTRFERLIDRYVKRDEILRERIRQMEKAEPRTEIVKPIAKP